jgi:hypothetical protein
MGRLWRDPAMKPFRDKFMGKLTGDLLTPLERQLGVQLADYAGLAQGQLTFAVVPVERPQHPDDHYAGVIILDTGDHAARLATNLADIKKKWVEAGKTLKTEKIREAEFVTLIATSDDFSEQKLFPKLAGTNDSGDARVKTTNTPVELTFGQSGSLLLVSQASQAIEKIMARQSGGLIPALDEQPAFQSDFAARLEGAPFFAWVNAKDLLAGWVKQQPADSALAGAFADDGAMSALGVKGLTSASMSFRDTPEGLNLRFFIGNPESGRRGLLKMMATEAKDSSPPPFVPADAVKFSRMRVDIPAGWRLLESTVKDLYPQQAQLLNYVLDLAGKDKDEKYDLRAELLASLGDDIISWQRNPVNNTLGDLKSPPSIFMIGSPNPEKLAAAIKVALGVATRDIKEREFLGRKIYSAPLPTGPQGTAKTYHFAASAGYVAFSGEVEMIEEFLRNSDGQAKGLAQTPGLNEAAQKDGGYNAGIFGFSNDKEGMRTTVETLRQEPIGWADVMAVYGMQTVGAPKISTVEDANHFKEWADFSLLPPVDVLTKYFTYSVWVGGFTPEGFCLSSFTPAAK